MEAPTDGAMFSYLCGSCGVDLKRHVPVCPHCGGRRFQAGFRPPFSISGTKVDVRFPLLSSDPHKAVVTSSGKTVLSYRDASTRYRFADIQAALKTGIHWVKIRTKENARDGKYLDILFGRRSPDPKSHVGFVIEARTLFVAPGRMGTEIVGTHLFDTRARSVRPVTRTLIDPGTQTAVRLSFGLDIASETIHMTGVQFYRMPAATMKEGGNG